LSENNDRPSEEALFRFHVLGAIRAHVAGGGSAGEMIERLAAMDHTDLRGHRRRLSARTLYRWCEAWVSEELAGLEPASRPRVQRSAIVPAALLDFCERERKADRDASVPELIKRARVEGVIARDLGLDRTTVWRALRRMGVSTSRRTRQAQRDAHRFAYPNRMLMVLADGKHFRAGIGRLRRVALFFLDDATRYVVGVIVGTSESTELFLRGLHGVLFEHGLMNLAYLDHGPGFISDDTVEVFARLKIPLIHGQARYPEGHGKIERFNRTVLASVLRSYDDNPDVDPELGHLTLRLQRAVAQGYNRDPHEALDGQSPLERWTNDPRPLRPAPGRHWLRERFCVRLRRTVTTDNVVSFESVHYEMPRGHAGERVVLRRPVLEPGVLEFTEGEELFRLQPVNVHANAYERRTRPSDTTQQDDESLPVQTAADRDFQQAFAPLVDEDGGYPQRRDEHGKQDRENEDH